MREQIYLIAAGLLATAFALPGWSQPTSLDFVQESYIKPSNLDAGDRFGFAVAVDGDVMAVSAINEAGRPGNGDVNTRPGSGAVYVFRRTRGVWAQEAYLKASNAGINDNFGVGLAIDGTTIVVGASAEASAATGVNGSENDNSAANAGAAYVFFHDGASWSQQAYLKASNTDGGDFFGDRVAIDGDTIVVGAGGESSFATGVDGNGASNSLPNSGAAYVFRRSNGGWMQDAYLKASNPNVDDSFGGSVAVSGDVVIVGALLEDGTASGGGSDNDATDAGAAYVFERIGGMWQQTAYLKGANTEAGDGFGTAAIDGDTIVISAVSEDSASRDNPDLNDAVDSGAAYVFVRDGGSWSQQAFLTADNAGPGDQLWRIAINGDLIIAGAFREAGSATTVNGPVDNNAPDAGAAYLFRRIDTEWIQEAYLKAANTNSGDFFGWEVSVSGLTALVGAWGEASTSREINGDAGNNVARFTGAAYTFISTFDPDLVFRDSLEAATVR